MKNKKKVNIFKVILSVVMLLLSLICFKYVYDMNIIPNKYLYIFLGILLGLNIISSLFLFLRGLIFKVLSVILYFILAIISVVGIKYAGNTLEFLNNSFNNSKEYIVYNVLVSNNSNFKAIDELNNSNMGYLFVDVDNDDYLDIISKKINVKLKEYGVSELYDKLINSEIESIVINEGYLDLLEEEIDDFSSNTRLLYTYKVEVKKDDNIVENKIEKLEPLSIYLSGSDSRSGTIASSGLSDVNMIITINPNTHNILLTSIPRDYYVQLHGTTGLKDKLTHAGFYGIDMSKNTIEDFMNIELDYSIKVGFNSVIKLVDLVGGIDVYSDISFKSRCGDGGAERVHINEGMNHLNGAQALSYARERYAYIDGDRHRVRNQQQVLEAVFNKIISDKSMLLKYDSLLNSFSDLYVTDIPKEFITLLIKHQLEEMPSWTIESQSLDGYGASGKTYSMPGYDNLYVMIPYEDTIISASKKINEILNPVVLEDNSEFNSIDSGDSY